MRKGMTLLELLVVVAIIGLLLALTIPAVQRVRESSLRAQSLNNLRQFSLATQNFASVHPGRLPRMDLAEGKSVFFHLLPYLEQQTIYNWGAGVAPNYFPPEASSVGKSKITIPVFLNPLDPSASFAAAQQKLSTRFGHLNSETSYAFNAQVFYLFNSMNAIRDGTSNTIFFSEHYWQCAKAQTHFVATQSGLRNRQTRLNIFPASFAEGGPRINNGQNCRDFYPVSTGNPPVAAANRYNAMFQVQPSEQNCDPRVPNASSSAGLQAAMGDGSVRIFSPSTAPSVFWGAVTPNSGEVIAFD